jgi:SPP1 gp7 family putative phage head morphogenesis protein
MKTKMKPRSKRTGKLKPRKNPLKIDPSRTGLDRRKISREIERRFSGLKKELHQLIVIEDALGLGMATNEEGENCGTGAGGFKPGNTCAKGSSKIERRTMYRGVGDGADVNSGFEWYSTTPGLAQKYADFRGGAVISKEISIKAPLEIHNPHKVLDAKSFFSDASKQVDIKTLDKDKVLAARGEFLSHFGFGSREVIDYWSNPEAKESTRKLLESMGFDSIRMSEGKEDTIAILRPASIIQNSVIINTRWAFLTVSDKLREFVSWLKTRVAIGILSTSYLQEPDHWLQEHIQRMYFKGVSRAFDEVRNPTLARSLDWYEGTRGEFLRSSFGRAVDMARVKLLASRAFNELNGVTDQMGQTIQRELADGMILGESPRTVGARLNKVVEGYKNRGLTIARTETLRAHNEGALDAMEKLGVEEIGVMVEWSTAEDEKVCPLCKPLQGVVMKIKEAHGLLPRHPNCRCVPIPANVGEDTSRQKRSKEEIEEAIDQSVQAESPNRPIEEQRKRSSWQGADLEPSKKRPKSILED